MVLSALFFLFICFLNDTPITEIYTLSLHDALPIFSTNRTRSSWSPPRSEVKASPYLRARRRSEEHTSELQSLTNLVCRLLLEKKKKPGSTVDYAVIHRTTVEIDDQVDRVQQSNGLN